MKNLFLITLLILASFEALSQAPEKISYQAIIRNSSNQLLINQNIGMRIGVLQGSMTGSVMYSEIHNTTTNQNGLVSIEMGTGNVLTGTFASIDWANGPYYVQIETDPTGGTNYTLTSTSQLLSVPYALYAKTAGSSTLNWAITGNQGVIPSQNFVGTSDSLDLRFRTNNLNRMHITANGNVGIGSSPIADNKLHLRSDDGLSLRFKVVESVNYAEIQTDKAGGSYLVLQKSGGRVGIGTAVPSSILEVSDNQAEISLKSTGLGYHHGAILFTAQGQANKRGLGLYFHDVLGGNEWFVGRPFGTSAGGNSDQFVINRLLTTNHDQSAASLYDSGNNSLNTVRLLTLNNQGYLGLGTSTPQRTLHVNQAMRLEPMNTPPTNPGKGDIYFDNVLNKLRVWDGTTWQNCW